MGKITVRVDVTNLFDWHDQWIGRIEPEKVRFVSMGSPTLIGYIVLERLDLYPDPATRTLTGRPDSPDHVVIECYQSGIHPNPQPL